jgi:hypothetical protein
MSKFALKLILSCFLIVNTAYAQNRCLTIYRDQLNEETDPKGHAWINHQIAQLLRPHQELLGIESNTIQLKLPRRFNVFKNYQREHYEYYAKLILQQLKANPTSIAYWLNRKGLKVRTNSELEKKQIYNQYLLADYILKNGLKSILVDQFGNTNLTILQKARLNTWKIFNSKILSWSGLLAVTTPPYLPIFGRLKDIKLDEKLAQEIIWNGLDKNLDALNKSYSKDQKLITYEILRQYANKITLFVIVGLIIQQQYEEFNKILKTNEGKEALEDLALAEMLKQFQESFSVEKMQESAIENAIKLFEELENRNSTEQEKRLIREKVLLQFEKPI